ncbi:MAG: FkbM family methyltransferase [Snowella sp.]
MLQNLKDQIKFKLAKILTPEVDKKLKVNQRISTLEQEILELKQKLISVDQKNDQRMTNVMSFGVSPWYEENLWEPTVQIILRDLCKSGDIVFDVGANFAGLTTVMSRIVGPKGVVCAFEASPRIIDKTQRNLVLSGCNNVQLFHNAVYHTSGKKVKIFLGDHLNDSIYSEYGEDSSYEVKTLALDDFIATTQIIPNLVKMDIEGAEFDALKGFVKTLKTAKPHLILETQREDTRCLDFLRDLGYSAIDLNTYQEITVIDDYPLGANIRNNLYIHRDRHLDTPYHLPFHFQEYKVLSEKHFNQQADGSTFLNEPLVLEAGRYVMDVDFTALGIDNEMMCGVKSEGVTIFQYHAYSHLLASSYRDWIIDLAETASITIYFQFQNGTRDDSFVIKGARINKIANIQLSNFLN